MKRTLASLLVVGLICGGTAAYAQQAQQQSSTQDEYSQSQTTPNQSTTTSTTTTTSKSSSKHEVMKDCVAREQAGNSTMSTSDAKKACHDAMKAQRDNQDNEPRPQT